MLFGLSLGMALPPAAIVTPPGTVRPTVRPDAATMLVASELTAVLNRADRRGLARTGRPGRGGRAPGRPGDPAFSVFQVTDESGALICLSAVRRDPGADGVGGATPADLWELACQALARYGIPHERLVGIGDDAFLATYGGVTAQVAWLAGARLTTASVTCLAREPGWAADAARTIAVVLDRHLR